MKTSLHTTRAGPLLATASALLLGLGAQAAQFEDVSSTSGIGQSSGVCYGPAWGDYNNDGFPDLYITAGIWPSDAQNFLFRNAGNGTFVRVEAEAGPVATETNRTAGCAWVDFDNDGFRDLFLLNGYWFTPRPNDLYWNHGDGTFSRGQNAELTSRNLIRTWQACADFDGDGWVDVAVSGEGTTINSLVTQLYRATGHGTFTRSQLGAALKEPNACVWADYDNDGDPDLFVTDVGKSPAWRNEGRGQFTAVDLGPLTDTGSGHYAWADYDNDGDLDVAVSTYTGTWADHQLFRNENGAAFVHALTLTGAIGFPSWADYDNDGHLDFLAMNAQGVPVKAMLYHNNGDGTFSLASDVFTEQPDVWGEPAWGDYDNDGFMDLLLLRGVSNRLYHNLRNANHWLKFNLTGTVSNRDALGAKVRVLATIRGQAVWQMREVGTGGALQENDPRPNFGLGDATKADRVIIEWPSGNQQELTDVPADQIVSVTEVAPIAPLRPSVSVNGGIILRSTGAAFRRQWRFEGVDLAGKNSGMLPLKNLTAAQAGRYSVVVDNGSAVVTNFTYVTVDPTFKQITEGPVATDQITSFSGHFGDVDGDGLLDLVALGYYYYAGANTRFYHNEGQGKFTAVTDRPWANMMDRAAYSAWADTDNDGDLDLLVGVEESQNPFLLRNDGTGAFTRLLVNQDWISNRVQVRGAGWSWADFDGDGWLDAVVNGQRNFLLRNNRDDTFTVLTNSPIHQVRDYLSAQWVDFDNDGDVDLFGGLDMPSGYIRVYRNDGQSVFTDISETFANPRLGPGCGAAFGDFDSDGDLDLYFAGWGPPQRFLVNTGRGAFTDWTGAPLTMLNLSEWGLPFWGDYDNDGYLDLYVAQNFSRCRLFRNQGDGNFVEVTLGTLVNDPQGGICAAWADHDNDGDLDLFLAHFGKVGLGNQFYENLNSGNGNHWLKVRLRGTVSNSHAVGAKVGAWGAIGGKTVRQTRVITANQWHQELEAHFGLGDATRVSQLRIQWPSGKTQLLANVAADQILTLWEPPALKASLQPNGACVLNIRAEPNRDWQIQASSDLAAWQTLTTVTNTTFAFQYTDTTAVGVGSRFYRVGSE